jgi:hypothetical protein
MSRRFWLPSVMVLMVGCAKLDAEKTATLEGGDFKAFSIDGPSSEQKVNVSVTSTGASIDAYVVLEGDPDAALKIAAELMRGNKPPASVVDSKQKITQGTLSATIPAKKGYSILLVNGSTKQAEVKVKITGR